MTQEARVLPNSMHIANILCVRVISDDAHPSVVGLHLLRTRCMFKNLVHFLLRTWRMPEWLFKSLLQIASMCLHVVQSLSQIWHMCELLVKSLLQTWCISDLSVYPFTRRSRVHQCSLRFLGNPCSQQLSFCSLILKYFLTIYRLTKIKLFFCVQYLPSMYGFPKLTVNEVQIYWPSRYTHLYIVRDISEHGLSKF